MKIIKYENALQGTNSDKCKIQEYSFGDKDIDLGIAVITGRYPESGYCKNIISKELIYVLEGSGIICFENENIKFSAGDSILIDKDEKYYWDTTYCKVSLTCTPSWSEEQYILIN